MDRQTIILLLLIILICILYNHINLTEKIIEIPYSIKCFFNEPKCDEGNIDGQTLIYGLIYVMIGLMIPNKHIWIILLSISIEIIRPYLNLTPKYIVNPLIGITGYSFGSYLSDLLLDKEKLLKEKYYLLNK